MTSLSARSTAINFKPHPHSDYDTVRLYLSDKGWIDVDCRNGSAQLYRVSRFSIGIMADLVAQLHVGQGYHQKVSPDSMHEVSFKIDKQVRIGGEPLIQCFIGEKFFRVFIIQSKVVDAFYRRSSVSADA